MRESESSPPPPSDRVAEWTCACGRALQVPNDLVGVPIDCPWCGQSTGVNIPSPAPDKKVEDGTPSDGRRGSASRWLLGLALIGAVVVLTTWNPFLTEKGVQLRYRVLFSPTFEGSRQKGCERALRVLVRRSSQAGCPAEGWVEGPDRVVLRVSMGERSRLEKVLSVVGRYARFGLHPSAPKSIQERFNRDGTVPPGYRAMRNVSPSDRQSESEYGIWNVDRILVADTPVVSSRHIRDARAERELGINEVYWVTSFEMDREGAERFDEAAKELYNRNPRGILAIVLDGEIKSVPVVQAEVFRGMGQVTGMASGEEGKKLAIVLRSGELPAPVGRYRKGKPEFGVPEKVEWYGFEDEEEP